MEWNIRPQVVQKWQPFGVHQMHTQQQQQQHVQHQQMQQQHHSQQHQQVHHPQAHASSGVVVHQQQSEVQQQVPQHSSKANKGSCSLAPHCLVCNVHLGMFAKGGMEVFSEKVTTTHKKQQVHSVLSTIVNQELNTTVVHSNIVCKKCFKLIDDIDAMEDKLINMKQVVSTKYRMTLALVKRGMVGKAVIDEHTKPRPQREADVKKENESPVKEDTEKAKEKKGKKPLKPANLSVKSGKLVVKKQVEEHISEDDGDDLDRDDLAVVVIEDISTVENFDDEISFICSVCDKAFDSKNSLVSHMEEHGLKEDWLTCSVCDKGFLTAESLSKHKKLHSGYGPKKQKKKVLAASSRVNKQFRCNLCDKIFNTKSKAMDHERTHTGEKPFECDICGVCFRQKSNLASHKRVTHLQEKRYKCDLCGKEFKWKRLLKGHTMSVHTGERPYKCEFCDAGFVYQQHFKKHMRIHTGEKPFKCEICGKAFNSSNNCRAHMYTHSDSKPYECKICGAGFMRKPLVMTHIKQHTHATEIEDIEVYVKFNSPSAVTAALIDEHNVRNVKHTSYSSKKKVKSEPQQGSSSIYVAQAGHQSSHNTMEETVTELFIPEQVISKEQTSSGETVNYMFGNFQSQAPNITHYTSLSLGQW